MTFLHVPGGVPNIVMDGKRAYCKGCKHYADRPVLAYGFGECVCLCHTGACRHGTRWEDDCQTCQGDLERVATRLLQAFRPEGGA